MPERRQARPANTAPASVPAKADIFESLLSEILTKCFLFPYRKGRAQLLANTDEKGHKRAVTEQHAQAKGKGIWPPGIFVSVCITIMPPGSCLDQH